MLTRKHFNEIANELKYLKPATGDHQHAHQLWQRMVVTMARICRGSNPQFKTERFYDACDYDHVPPKGTR